MKRNRMLICLGTTLVIGGMLVQNSYANENDIEIKNDLVIESNYNENEPNYAKMILDEQLESMLKEVDEYGTSNPNATDEELNDFFKALIIKNYDPEKIEQQERINNRVVRSANYGVGNYLPVVSSKLNPYEMKVFNSNPIKGANCLVSAKDALNHTSWLFKRDNYGYHNDNADAFRHTFWNALMARRTGSSYAKQFADAHEKNSGNSKLEASMDFSNNASGRTIGSKSYSGSDVVVFDRIKAEVLKSIKTGKLKRFWGNDIGKRTSLTYTNSNGLK